jgi:hypothetical protein
LRQPDAELFLVALGLGLDGQRDDRLGEVHRLEHDGLLLVAQRVAGAHLLQADGRRDVAGVDLLDLLTLVGVHLQEAAHPLGALLGRVVDDEPGREHARVDADEGELADERSVISLNASARTARRPSRTLDRRLFLRVGIEALNRGHVERRRQIVDRPASSSGCTPLFLNAVPQMTTTNAVSSSRTDASRGCAAPP